MKDKEDIGQTIRRARGSRGMTMEDLAEMLGVSHATVSRWESGQNKPRRRMVYKLGIALGISDWIASPNRSSGTLDGVDMTLPMILSCWDSLTRDDRLRVVEMVSRLAGKNASETS